MRDAPAYAPQLFEEILCVVVMAFRVEWPPMFFVRMALNQARNFVSSAPDRLAKSAASTYAVSCRPSDRTACEQPSFWLAMPAITPARALVP